MKKITLEEAKRLVEENRMIGYKIDDCNEKKILNANERHTQKRGRNYIRNRKLAPI